MAAFDIGADGSLSPRWRRRQNHASHLVLLPGSGVMVTGDHDRERFLEQVVALDVTTGEELVRADHGRARCSRPVFPALGHDGTRLLVLDVLGQPGPVRMTREATGADRTTGTTRPRPRPRCARR